MTGITKCFVASATVFGRLVFGLNVEDKTLPIYASLPANFDYSTKAACERSLNELCNLGDPTSNELTTGEILGCGVVDNHRWKVGRLGYEMNFLELYDPNSLQISDLFECHEIAALVGKADQTKNCFSFHRTVGTTTDSNSEWKTQGQFVKEVEKSFSVTSELKVDTLKIQASISYEKTKESIVREESEYEYAGSSYKYYTPLGELKFRLLENLDCAVALMDKLDISGYVPSLEHENMYELAEDEKFQKFVENGNLIPFVWKHSIEESQSCEMAYESASSTETQEVTEALKIAIQYNAIETSTELQNRVRESFGEDSSSNQVSCNKKTRGCGAPHLLLPPVGDGCNGGEGPCLPAQNAHRDCAVAISGSNPNLLFLEDPTAIGAFVDLPWLIETYFRTKCDNGELSQAECDKVGLTLNDNSQFDEKIKMFERALLFYKTPCEYITDCEGCLRSMCAYKKQGPQGQTASCMSINKEQRIWRPIGSTASPFWPGTKQHSASWKNGVANTDLGTDTIALYPDLPDENNVVDVCNRLPAYQPLPRQIHSEWGINNFMLTCPAGYAVTAFCGSSNDKNCRSEPHDANGKRQGTRVVAWVECNDFIPVTAWHVWNQAEGAFLNPNAIAYVAGDAKTPGIAEDTFNRATCAPGYATTSFCHSKNDPQCRFLASDASKTHHTTTICTPYPGLREASEGQRQKQYLTNVYAYNTYSDSDLKSYGLSNGGCTNHEYVENHYNNQPGTTVTYKPRNGVVTGVCVTRRRGETCRGYDKTTYAPFDQKYSSGLCTMWGTTLP